MPQGRKVFPVGHFVFLRVMFLRALCVKTSRGTKWSVVLNRYQTVGLGGVIAYHFA